MLIRSYLLNRALLAGLTIVVVAFVACTSSESTELPTDETSNEPANSASLGVPVPVHDGLVDEMIVITDVATDDGGHDVHPATEGGKVVDGAGIVGQGSIEPATSASLGMPAPGCEGLIDEMVVLEDTEVGGRNDIEVLPVERAREVVQGKDPVEVAIHVLPGIEVEPVEPVAAPSLPPSEDVVTTVSVTNRWTCDAVQEPQVEVVIPKG